MPIFGTSAIELPHDPAPYREMQSEEEESDMNHECPWVLGQCDSREDVKPVGKKREHQDSPMLLKNLYVPHHS